MAKQQKFKRVHLCWNTDCPSVEVAGVTASGTTTRHAILRQYRGTGITPWPYTDGKGGYRMPAEDDERYMAAVMYGHYRMRRVFLRRLEMLGWLARGLKEMFDLDLKDLLEYKVTVGYDIFTDYALEVPTAKSVAEMEYWMGEVKHRMEIANEIAAALGVASPYDIGAQVATMQQTIDDTRSQITSEDEDEDLQ